ncbi:MAG TPA: transcription termination/antitermination NusG family protein [Pirellulaceae bacterium]|nr:transcription termination/antitermination NusG family protein [Pirellulaceae bacterium]
MPILASETHLHPAQLLDGISDPADAPRKWWAVYTKSRQEKSLARDLLSQDIPFYLPLVPKVSVIAGRRVKSELPLFGSYLFLFATDDERVLTLATKRVAHLVSAPDATEITRALRQIQQLIAAGVPMTVEGRLCAGRRVRIKHGSLMGLEGVVVARRGEDRLLVTVDFLQQGVSILISDYQVEPV